MDKYFRNSGRKSMVNEKGLGPEKGVPVTGNVISPTTVTEVKVFPLRNEGTLVGIATCVIDGKFHIVALGIYYENGRYRITYPTKKYKNSSIMLFHPINEPAADAVYNEIIQEYESLMRQGV